MHTSGGNNDMGQLEAIADSKSMQGGFQGFNWVYRLENGQAVTREMRCDVFWFLSRLIREMMKCSRGMKR